jgi:endonuclease/exonuclease/phosphatase family metal-dependent hydrolase
VRARTLLAAALAAPWVLFALARLVALDRWVDAFVPVVSFTPWALLTAPLPVVAALVLRRRAIAVAAVAAGVALAAVVAPRSIGEEARPGSQRLTVLATNLLFGAADPRRVAALARDADVVVLTELPGGVLPRFDAAGLGARFPHRVLDVGVSRRRNGTAILSREPLTRLPVPETGVAQPAALVRRRGRPDVRVHAVHPPPPIDGERIAQWRASLEALLPAGPGEPLTVLAGDFNATLDHAALRAVLDRGLVDAADAVGAGLRPTWPRAARRPPITIDHVLADRRIAVRAFTVHDVAGTDHSAVVADLVLPELP